MVRSFKFGLLGHNISYSKSADIFKAIFELNELSGEFENFDLSDLNFESEFKRITQSKIDGLSVTIPFKSRVIPLLNEISPVAKSLDAVNSIAVGNDMLYGYNTDVTGFSLPLLEHSGQLKNGSALILGCGGSARAVVYALHTDYEVSDITVVGRDQSRLQNFQNAMRKILLNTEIKTGLFENLPSQSKDNLSIVVNCTPLGGWNKPEQSPLPENFNWAGTKIYYDLNYNDNNSAIKKAIESGLKVFDGSQMLVGQALRSFEIWTGQTADFKKIYNRVFGKKVTI